MCEEALRALAVIVPSMPHSAIRCPNGQPPTVKFTSASVAIFGSFVDNLVKGRVYVISKLDLCYRCAAHSSCSNAKANNALWSNNILGRRSVSDWEKSIVESRSAPALTVEC